MGKWKWRNRLPATVDAPTSESGYGTKTPWRSKKRIDLESDDEFEETPVRWLTDKEALAVLDLQARRRLGMSGDKFLRRWRAGSFSEAFKEEHHSDYFALSILASPLGKKESQQRIDPKTHDPGECTMAIEKRFVAEIDDQSPEMAPTGLTDEEALAVLDKQARSRLGMSGEEFLQRWRDDAFSQEFKDEHHSAFAFLSVMVAPFVR